MTAFAGIDYSTFAIDIVVVYEEERRPAWWHFDLGDSEYAFDRARDVRDVMPPRGNWQDEGIIGIGIEEQASGNPAMRATVQKLKMIQGAILSCLPRDMLVMPLEATRWRKELEIPGNASKDHVRAWVALQLGPDPDYRGPIWSQDACDAYCLARAVQKLAVLS